MIFLSDMKQKEIILEYLKKLRSDDPEGGWVLSYQLHATNTPFGWLGPTGRRLTQELAQEGKIEVRHNGKYAEYRALSEVSVSIQPYAPKDSTARRVCETCRTYIELGFDPRYGKCKCGMKVYGYTPASA